MMNAGRQIQALPDVCPIITRTEEEHFLAKQSDWF